MDNNSIINNTSMIILNSRDRYENVWFLKFYARKTTHLTIGLSQKPE